jgi:uncharacterized phage protein (TIGR02218 family)
MSYLASEQSVDSGSPVELYTFNVGTTNYRFTSGAESVLYSGNTFDPLPVSREAIVIGREDRADLIAITMPSAHPFAAGYAKVVPGNRATLTIQRFHRSDPIAELLTLFKGVVRSVTFSDKGGMSRVGVMPISGALARQIPRFTFQGLCNNVLFDSWCTISSAAFKYTGAASAPVALQFDVTGLGAAKGDDWATAGFATYNGDYRLILKQLGNTLTLLLPFNDDVTGHNVDVFAGCDHSLKTCNDKFSNLINFNGYPYIPTKNPFATGLS